MRTLLLAIVAVACCSAGNTAAAQCGAGGMGYGFGIGQLYQSLEGRVPYFAAHPPVYYSYPVPRTYGHSPFAYPPHFRTPELVEEVQPLQISNPYVPSSNSTPAEDATVLTKPSSEPLVINNPYVDQKSQVMNASLSL